MHEMEWNKNKYANACSPFLSPSLSLFLTYTHTYTLLSLSVACSVCLSHTLSLSLSLPVFLSLSLLLYKFDIWLQVNHIRPTRTPITFGSFIRITNRSWPSAWRTTPRRWSRLRIPVRYRNSIYRCYWNPPIGMRMNATMIWWICPRMRIPIAQPFSSYSRRSSEYPIYIDEPFRLPLLHITIFCK